MGAAISMIIKYALGSIGQMMSGAGDHLNGITKQQIYGVQADLAERGAKEADIQAGVTMRTMGAETKQMQKSARQLKSSQRLAYASMGADTSGDTPLLVMEEQAGEIAMDIAKHRRNRLIEVQQLRSTRDMLRYDAKVKRWLGVREEKASAFKGAARAFQ